VGLIGTERGNSTPLSIPRDLKQNTYSYNTLRWKEDFSRHNL